MDSANKRKDSEQRGNLLHEKRMGDLGARADSLGEAAYGVNLYISNKIGDEVVKMTEDPAVQKVIDKAIEEAAKEQSGTSTAPQTGQSTEGTAQTPAAKEATKPAVAPATGEAAPVLKNRDEAISYAKSKFSTGEIATYTTKFLNKDKLTAAEKNQIKAEIMSRFTAEELRALQAAAAQKIKIYFNLSFRQIDVRKCLKLTDC